MSGWFSHGPSHPQAVQTDKDAFWYLNLTHEQQAAFEKYQEHLTQTNALQPGHADKYTLLRFLKARQWDVAKATIMYNNMTKWRREHGTDKLYETFQFPELDAVLQHYPHFYHKTDKFGRPVYIELLGATDPSRLLAACPLDRLLAYHVCEWEALERNILPACSVLAGKPIITKDVILDLKGVSMKNFGAATQKILKTVAVIDQDYYCEHLGQMFIINTPAIFRLIWAVVNPLLEERTRRKIVILGADYLPTLTQLVPEENLPTLLGGKSELPDMRTSIGPWTEVQLPPREAQAQPAEELPANGGGGGDGGGSNKQDGDGRAAAAEGAAVVTAAIEAPGRGEQKGHAAAPGAVELQPVR